MSLYIYIFSMWYLFDSGFCSLPAFGLGRYPCGRGDRVPRGQSNPREHLCQVRYGKIWSDVVRWATQIWWNLMELNNVTVHFPYLSMGFRWKHKFSMRFEGSFRTFTCHTALPIPKHSCNMLDTYGSYCWLTWARPPSVRDSTESGIIMEQAETQQFFASFAWSNKAKGMNWSGFIRIHQDSLRM